MNIKKRLTLTIICLTVIPLVLFCLISFFYFKNIIASEIGVNFVTLANDNIEKIDRTILERKKNLLSWASLNVMQEILADDIEGNIQKNIISYINTYPEIFEIIVTNDKKKIIASNNKTFYSKEYPELFLNEILKGSIKSTDLYFDEFLNHSVVAIGAPVILEGMPDAIGAIIIFLPVELIYSINDSIKMGGNQQSENGYSIILNKKFELISAPEFMRKNKNFKQFTKFKDEQIIKLLTNKKTGYFTSGDYLYGYSTEKEIGEKNLKFEGNGWILLNLISTQIAFHKIYNFMFLFMFAIIIFALIIIIISLLFSKNFTLPIIKFSELFVKGASGDLTVKYPLEYENKCFEQKNCQKKKCNCHSNKNVYCWYEKNEYKNSGEENIIHDECKICSVYKKNYKDEIETMAILFNKFILNLKHLLMQLQDMSNTIEMIVNKTISNMELITNGAQDQNTYNSTIRDTINNINASIEKVNISVVETQGISQNASAAAERGKKVLEKTIAGLNEIHESTAQTATIVNNLSDSSKQIVTISKTIEGISEQTNLLALNAAIEAARAGEAGAGFTVVAEEVRKLANKSKEKTDDINKIVNTIKEQIDALIITMNKETENTVQGVKLISEFQNTFNGIENSINSTITSINNMSSLFSQLYGEMEGINLKVESVSQISSAQSENADKTSGVIRQLIFLINKLNDTIKQFKTV